MNTWELARATFAEVREGPGCEVAILPLGATEPHNLHLPYATDTMQVEELGRRICARASETGARVCLLPAIPYGTETNLMRFPLAINLNPSTLARVIHDIVASLETHDVRKLLLLNGHGGNDLKWVLRELYGQTSVHLFLCHWYKVAADCYRELFSDPGDHAGALETSLMLAHFGDLVALTRADKGEVATPRFEALRRGWVEITRPWHLLTTQSGVGNPHEATAEKGHAVTDFVVERIGRFLAELAASELDERFPY